ncbi:MAG: hypothetical protein IK024_01855 [Treponema sp.]|nr:hypothetical protein [Treponema sp.]
MKYKVECIISKISIKNNKLVFKICGTEGYSIKIGKDKYIVLITDEIEKIKELKCVSSFVIIQNIVFETKKSYSVLLTAAMTCGKRVRLTGETSEKEIKSAHIKVSSISLLND